MCDLADAIGARRLEEVESIELDELLIRLVRKAERENAAERRMDLRFGTVCSALALFLKGSNEGYLPDYFFPKPVERGGNDGGEDRMSDSQLELLQITIAGAAAAQKQLKESQNGEDEDSNS